MNITVYRMLAISTGHTGNPPAITQWTIHTDSTNGQSWSWLRSGGVTVVVPSCRGQISALPREWGGGVHVRNSSVLV